MALRYDGTCAGCGCSIAARSKAWWDSAGRLVTCLTCLPADSSRLSPRAGLAAASQADAVVAVVDARPVFPPSSVVDCGVGGISAAKEYERRSAKHAHQIEANWGTGHIGRFAKFISEEPQSTTAWAKGADGDAAWPSA